MRISENKIEILDESDRFRIIARTKHGISTTIEVCKTKEVAEKIADSYMRCIAIVQLCLESENVP